MTHLKRTLALAAAFPLPLLTLLGIGTGLIVRYGFGDPTAGERVLLVTLLAGGAPIVARTSRGVVRGRFAADIVATLSILVSLLIGEYLAGCVIVLMQSGGEALEAYGVRRASATLRELLARAPQMAYRRDGQDLVPVPVEQVAVGDQLLVRPGDLVPVDAVVVVGQAAVDESALTGEPVPRPVGPGDELMSGSGCLDGALDVRVLRRSAESQYERIVRMVTEAQQGKAPIGRLADGYAVAFTPLTLVTAVAAYALTGRLEAVLAVLVVATPCPLILAAPVAIMAGVNRAAAKGILVKSGGALERVGNPDAVVFDKTGTLTTGRPVVDRALDLNGMGTHDALRLAACVEQLSGHPMARALVEAWRAGGEPLPRAEELVEIPGQGVVGKVEGRLVEVGSAAFVAARGLAPPDVLARAAAHGQGAAAAFVAVDGRLRALVVFTDQPRPGLARLTADLRALGVREISLLTGDDRATAERVAMEAGIVDIHADLLPGDKVALVRSLLARLRTVVMVGDGVNDAPALASATVGIAMAGHGAPVASEAADIVITVDDLSRVADAVRVGRRTLQIARQCIWVGMGASAVLMVIAAFGHIPPTLGALLQELLDVVVILSALRR